MKISSCCYEVQSVNNKLWSSLYLCNGIVTVENRKIFIKEHVINDDNMQMVLYPRVAQMGNKLFYIPFAGSSFVVIDTALADKTEIILKDIQGIDRKTQICKQKFWAHLVMENKIYVMGYGCPEIIEIDTENSAISVIDGWKDQLNVEDENLYINGLFTDGDIYEGVMFIPCGSTNKIMMLDLKNKYIKFITVDNKSDLGYIGLSIINDHMFLVTRGGDENYLLIVDVKNYELKKKINLSEGNLDGHLHRPIVINKRIYIFSTEKHRVAIIDMDYNVRYVNIECGCIDYRIAFSNKIQEKILFSTIEDGRWWIFNPQNEDVTLFNVELVVNDSDIKYYRDYYKKENIIFETDIIDLEDFLLMSNGGQ